MVTTRSACQPTEDPLDLLEALLCSNPSRAKVLLSRHPARASLFGPSGFCCLHAAALADAHRMVAPLTAAGLSPDQQIDALDGPGAFILRQFLRGRSQGKLPSSKLCAVFRGVTPLHIAAWLGHASTVHALLAAGANPETPCLEGRTALAIACYFLDCRPKRSQAIIDSLLQAGADPLCADFHGIGSLVLSPHCPPAIQQLLLDRVLLRFGGGPSMHSSSSSSTAPSEAGPSGSGGAAIASGSSGGSNAAAEAQAATASAAAAAQLAAAAAAAAAAPPGPPDLELGPGEGLELTPEKHVDVLQAALVAKHWQAFDFFLAATSAEAQYPVHSVNRILSLAIVSGDTRLVLRILHSGLQPDAGGNNSQGHPHVAVAAVHGHEDVLDVLCTHGGGVSLKALHHATETRSLKGLRLLLARGRPPVLTTDAPVHIGGAHSRGGELCVMLRLLRDTAFRLRYCYRIDMPRHTADSLHMVEALAEAGYRPTTYSKAIVHNGWIDLQGKLVVDYDPTADRPAAFDLGGVNRYTWLAAKREPWSIERHRQWPLRFQEAVRQLLLVYHAGQVASPAAGTAGTAAQALAAFGGESSSGSGVLTRGAKRARLELAQQRTGAAPAQPAPALTSLARKARQGGMGKGRGLNTESFTLAASAHAQQRQQQQAVAGGLAAAAVRPALAALPSELLLHIIQQAAYPISAWV